MKKLILALPLALALGGCQTIANDYATAQAEMAKLSAGSKKVLAVIVKNCPAATAATGAIAQALNQTATGSATANDLNTVAQATQTACGAATAIQAGLAP